MFVIMFTGIIFLSAILPSQLMVNLRSVRLCINTLEMLFQILWHMLGTFLVSGGAENVLVRWRLEDETKEFIPRMGSPIVHITVAPDNAFIAVAHELNGLNHFSLTYLIHLHKISVLLTLPDNARTPYGICH